MRFNNFTKNNKGAALILTISLIFVLLIFSTIIILRVINERNMIERERLGAHSLYMAEGGINAGIVELREIILQHLLTTLQAQNSSTFRNDVNGYAGTPGPGNPAGGLDFLLEYALDNGTQIFQKANDWTDPAITPMIVCDATVACPPLTISGKTYQYSIFISQKDPPSLTAADTWDFPYDYQIVANGLSGFGTSTSVGSNVILSGDFELSVQRDNFSKYALFTNRQRTESGGSVWFDGTNTYFTGPVHTNGQFFINTDPEFTAPVTQSEPLTVFAHHEFPGMIALDADENPPRATPIFHAGFQRGVSSIAMPVSSKDEIITQATGGSVIPESGIHVPNNGTLLMGGIYVNGDVEIDLSTDADDNAVYTLAQESSSKTITVDINNNQTLIESSDESPQTFSGLPNGIDNIGTIIYVNGAISGIRGTVQRNTEITVASEGDIIVDNHIRYSDYSPAVGTPADSDYVPPSASNTKNLMGIASMEGNIRISPDAPDDFELHSTVFSPNGVFKIDDYTPSGDGDRGYGTLLGGSVQDSYGVFKWLSGGVVKGYTRNFVYDQRMSTGKNPPYFPLLPRFTIFVTDDITDKILWQESDT